VVVGLNHAAFSKNEIHGLFVGLVHVGDIQLAAALKEEGILGLSNGFDLIKKK
jgi:hypothetical protein